MRTAALVSAFSTALALAGLLSSCGKSPVAPPPLPPQPPPNGYRVSGQVWSYGVPVPGARVEVIAGRAARLGQETNSSGSYEFSGISGYTQFRVTKEGYQPQSAHTSVDRDTVLGFELTPGDDLSGTYTLTITAADQCDRGEGHLPEEARVRRYTAVVTQRGPELQVVLSGATFPVFGGTAHDSFGGRIEPGRVLFSLVWPDGDWPIVLEQLSTSTVLAFDGTVVATGPVDRLSGMLDGSIQVSEGDSTYPYSRHIGWCYSARHQFVLSR
jgi:hypothetical protein